MPKIDRGARGTTAFQLEIILRITGRVVLYDMTNNNSVNTGYDPQGGTQTHRLTHDARRSKLEGTKQKGTPICMF